MYLINVAILYKYQPCMPQTIYPVAFPFVCVLTLNFPCSILLLLVLLLLVLLLLVLLLLVLLSSFFEFLVDLALAVFPLLLTVLAPSRRPNLLVEADFWTPILSPRATHERAAPWDCLSFHQI
jgi:hypothetical protein